MKVLESIWGEATALFHRSRKLTWVDLLILVALAGLLSGLMRVSHEWVGQHRPALAIDLSPRALPMYTFFSLSRGLLAYVFSLAFTLLYGYWAAKDRMAERVLVPLLDILQSVPVLGFMPGLVLALVAIFPNSNIGLELAAVLMIFTGQAWNMTFSYYQSLRSVPPDLDEVGRIFGYSWWQRLKWIELPFATIGLVWNSMMSMAGGWFFLMINESFVLGDKDFRLPGVGSYMSAAVNAGDKRAMLWAVLAMTTMIVALDQLLWRPVVVWAQKFRVEEGGQADAASSWVLNLLTRSRLALRFQAYLTRRRKPVARPPTREKVPSNRPHVNRSSAFSLSIFAILLAVLLYGTLHLLSMLHGLGGSEWADIFASAGLTLGRVLLAIFLGSLWAVPVGIAIGLSPRLSRVLQPVVQVTASFPAPMLFPAVIALLGFLGVKLGWGSVLLMLLGTQWYILFNIVAGAMAIPADLREAGRSYRLSRWQRFRRIYFPATFPCLVTGWVTAAGGAWNASIVAEYVTFKGQVLSAHGLGSKISEAAAQADFPKLAASILVMSVVVIVFNRTVWKTLYRIAERQFSMSK